jgi:uncharacterized membrane protein YdjX (TVP38/TMEM64 family)
VSGDGVEKREIDGEEGGRSWWRFLPLALLALATATVFATGAHRLLSLDALLTYRDRLQALVAENGNRALLAYMGVYVTAVALSVPGAVFLTILGGFLFGWLVGGAAASVSATVGAVCVFLIARTSVGDILLRKAGPRLQGLADGFREDAFSYLLFLRFMPVFPFWLTNLAPALFGVSLPTFALATLIGVMPGTAAFAVAGAGFDSVVEAQRAARDACIDAGKADCGLELGISSILTPKLLAALGALGLVSLLPVALRRFSGGRLKRLASASGEKTDG